MRFKLVRDPINGGTYLIKTAERETETMAYSATYNGEEMTIQYTAQGGESHRPDMYEIEDVTVESMEILGVDVDFDSLPDALQSVILELSNEVEFDTES